MKKIFVILLAAMMILSVVACGKKPDPDTQDTKEEPQVSSQDTEEPEFPDGDPAEYSREYWEAKYPGENVCPFSIDEDGTEYSYYWVSGLEGWDGTMESWIEQPFNWNGWHKTEDGSIVNKDETLKITDEWANGDEALSSFCTVTTEPYDKESAGNTDPEDVGEVKHNVPDERSFLTQEGLACQENFVFSAKYIGTDEDKSEDNDGLYIDFFGEDALYYVQTGFDAEDGTINHIWGYTRLYHFYNDKDSYEAALAEVPEYALKEQNDSALYFTTGGVREVGAESYGELMDMFANQETDGGEFDNFTPFNG